jgi:hypothetical protein
MTESRSDFEVRHRYTASASYQFNRRSKWSTTLSGYYNHQSGRPFTVLTYSSGYSLNGDDYRYNDLMYIPANADEVIIQGGTWEQLDAFIHRAGLDHYRGQIAPRNASLGPWTTDFDIKVAQDIPVGYGDLELTLDLVNFLNLLNADWGHVSYMEFGNVQAVRYAGPDPETGKPRYQLYPVVRDPANNPLFTLDNVRSRWRAKLGVRWSF